MASQGTMIEKELGFRQESRDCSSAQSVPVPVATHFFQQEYLFAFATQAEIFHYVRTQCASEEVTRLPNIIAAWKVVQQRVGEVVAREAGFPDTMQVSGIASRHQAKLDSFAEDKLFQKTFSAVPVALGMVEIDKLVAPQRTVNLNYVDRLKAGYPEKPQMDDLLDICASPKRNMEPIQHLEVAPNTHVFSSPNSDIRFLIVGFTNLMESTLIAHCPI